MLYILNSIRTLANRLQLNKSWTSLEAARAPNFTQIGNECNEKYPKDDPWNFARSYQTMGNYQYNSVDECGENGCFVNAIELVTKDCTGFNQKVNLKKTFEI